MRDGPSVYEVVGGQEFFDELVDRFYVRVETDPVLRPLYPEGDLTDARRHLATFLAQFWGGPHTYSQERGHPRLRMRHLAFRVGPAERDAWFEHMSASVHDTVGARCAPAEIGDQMLEYFARSADFLVNQPGEGQIPLGPVPPPDA